MSPPLLPQDITMTSETEETVLDVEAIIDELLAEVHLPPVDPKASYRTRRVGLFEEAASALAALSRAPGSSNAGDA